mmetsp:Transcript_34939/g.104218  ORF Transcript_34939/g.104218 Transcript_34939/m.104218 type:complete len:204 (+) Transcript_34939:929-1540(+)
MHWRSTPSPAAPTFCSSFSLSRTTSARRGPRFPLQPSLALVPSPPSRPQRWPKTQARRCRTSRWTRRTLARTMPTSWPWPRPKDFASGQSSRPSQRLRGPLRSSATRASGLGSLGSRCPSLPRMCSARIRIWLVASTFSARPCSGAEGGLSASRWSSAQRLPPLLVSTSCADMRGWPLRIGGQRCRRGLRQGTVLMGERRNWS